MVTPIEMWELDHEGYHLVVNGKLQGQPVRMLIDTGANYSCFDRTFLESLGTEKPAITGQDEVNVGIGGNDFETYITEVDGFQMGRTQFPTMQVRALDLTAISEMYESVGFHAIQGIIGGDFLSRYQAVISYKTQKLTLKK